MSSNPSSTNTKKPFAPLTPQPLSPNPTTPAPTPTLTPSPHPPVRTSPSTTYQNNIPKYYIKIFDGTKDNKNLLLDKRRVTKHLLKNKYEMLLKHKEIILLHLNKVRVFVIGIDY